MKFINSSAMALIFLASSLAHAQAPGDYTIPQANTFNGLAGPGIGFLQIANRGNESNPQVWTTTFQLDTYFEHSALYLGLAELGWKLKSKDKKKYSFLWQAIDLYLDGISGYRDWEGIVSAGVQYNVSPQASVHVSTGMSLLTPLYTNTEVNNAVGYNLEGGGDYHLGKTEIVAMGHWASATQSNTTGEIYEKVKINTFRGNIIVYHKIAPTMDLLAGAHWNTLVISANRTVAFTGSPSQSFQEPGQDTSYPSFDLGLKIHMRDQRRQRR